MLLSMFCSYKIFLNMKIFVSRAWKKVYSCITRNSYFLIIGNRGTDEKRLLFYHYVIHIYTDTLKNIRFYTCCYPPTVTCKELCSS